MNVRLLRRVAKHILAEPRRLQMALVLKPLKDIPKKQQPPCGTAACIAGWALILGMKAKNPNDDSYFPQLNGIHVGAYEAAEALQIETPQDSRLFFVDRWPEKFRAPYEKARTAQRRAQLAVARIEHFIATGGDE